LAVTWDARFLSGRVFSELVFDAFVFEPGFELAFDFALDELALETGLAAWARRPVLRFRTRFIMAPLT
jgi:hypothetical protein